nr:hypothetical protein CFP56_79509 [Quercus suber]
MSLRNLSPVESEDEVSDCRASSSRTAVGARSDAIAPADKVDVEGGAPHRDRPQRYRLAFLAAMRGRETDEGADRGSRGGLVTEERLSVKSSKVASKQITRASGRLGSCEANGTGNADGETRAGIEARCEKGVNGGNAGKPGDWRWEEWKG